MCQSNAYLKKDGEKELIMEDVSSVTPGEDIVVLKGLMGKEKRVKATIKSMNLMDHEIILEES